MSDSSPSVLLAIPAFRCAPQIGRVLDSIDAPLLARVDRVVVIDNRSPDGTAEAAAAAGQRLGEKFAVWRNTENYGLGGTHKVAFDHAVANGYDLVAILHGDDQATPKELHRLLDRAVKESDAAAVLGSRFMRGSIRSGYAIERTLGNLVLNALYSIVSARWTTDLGSGLNVFRVSALRDGFYRSLDDRMTFNLDLLLAFYSRRAHLAAEPITWREADQTSNARNVAVASTAVRRLAAWRLRRPSPPRPARSYSSEAIA